MVKTKPSRRFSATLMIPLVCLMVLFSVGFASAWDFDNTYEYFDEVNTAVIHNCDIWIGWCWNEGEVLAEVTLTSPQHKLVHRGLDQLVGEFNFTTTGDFEDVFGEMYLTDMKNGQEMTRGKQYKYKQYKNVSVDDYETTCSDVVNGTGTSEVCIEEEIGNHIELQFDWMPVTNPNNVFYSGVTYEIGVFVDVEADDYGDWRPKILGVEIPEWASWDESLNAGMTHYVSLNESGNPLLDIARGDDCTNTGMTFGATGILGDAIASDGVDSSDWVDCASWETSYTTGMTFSAWVNFDSLGIAQWIAMQGNTDFYIGFPLTDNNLWVRHADLLTSPDSGSTRWDFDGTHTTGEWINIVTVWDDSTFKIYTNGVLRVTSTGASGTISMSSSTMTLGNNENHDSELNGTLDEVIIWDRGLTPEEVLSYYNEGSPLFVNSTEGTAPSVTLTSPADGANLTSANIDFISVVTDDQQVDNVTLYIDGVANETDTSGFNGTYTFSKVMSEGDHNWSILAYDNLSLSNQSETRTFNYTQPPIQIDLNNPSDAFVLDIPLVNMSCDAHDSLGVEGLNLTINGVVNETVTNSTAAQNLSINKELSFTEGIYIWGCQAFNTMATSASSNRTLNVTYSSPVITLILPANASNITTPSTIFTFNATDVNGINNVSLYIDGIFDQINTSGVNGSYQFSQTFTEGNHNWSVIANSILNKQTISSTRYVNVTYSSPVVTLINPGDNTNITNQNITFTFTATDDNGINNISFYINDILNETNTSGVNGSYAIQKTLDEGIYNWSVIANSILNKQTISSTNDFIVHLTAPTATITGPTGNEGYFLLGANETLSYSFTEPGANLSEHLEECWYEYNSDILGGFLSNNTQDSVNTSWDFITGDMFWITSTGENRLFPNFRSGVGSFLDSAKSTNGILISTFTESLQDCSNVVYTDESFFSASTIGYYACVKNEGNFKYIVRQNDFSSFGLGSRTNFTSFNRSVDLNCTGTSTEFLYEEGQNEISIFARDTFGFVANDTSSWTYDLVEIAQTSPTTAVESATALYTANVTYNSSNHGIITALLYVNGDSFAGTRSGSGDDATFITLATMPGVTNDTIISTHWTISLTNTTDTYDYDLTSRNVTVTTIDLALCNATNNVSFWNFTVYNETNLVEINSTFEATFSIRSVGSTSDNIFSYSDVTGLNSQFDFCITPSSLSYNADASIKLTKSGYVDKFYNYQEVLITNATVENSLYMMITGDSTSFIVHVVDVNAADVIGAEVRVQRFYQGIGQWLTTEILTTNDVGEAVGHLLAEDADYRFQVYQGGESIYNSSATKITCAISPCTVTLIIPTSIATGYEEVEDLTSSLTYSDTTNIFTYTYQDSSNDFSSARLYVYRIFPTNATRVVVCNETKVTTSGLILCNIFGSVNGTYRANGYITRASEFLDRRKDGVLGNSIYNAMGVDGVLWSIFLLIAIIMLGVYRPSMAIIFGTIGLIFIGLIGIIKLGVISIIAISAIAIILLMRIGRE